MSPRGGRALDGDQVSVALDADGYAVLPGLLAESDCAALIEGYDEAARFRSRVLMARHGFGQGEYKYFAYPLPDSVATLRETLYSPLSTIANRWHVALNIRSRFPRSHAMYLARCHRAGQRQPTPLLLRYGVGDYNCLHQDIYGEHVFPLQIAVLLSQPGDQFTGGEFVLTEQRPRRQSRVMVIPLTRGDGVVFPVRYRPQRGTRGMYHTTMRHGVSVVRSGSRHTLGLIFHDGA